MTATEWIAYCKSKDEQPDQAQGGIAKPPEQPKPAPVEPPKPEPKK